MARLRARTQEDRRVDAHMERCEEARVRGNDAYARRDWDTAISAYGAGISARAAAALPPDRRLFSNRAAAYVSKYLAVRDAGLELRGLLALAVTDAAASTAVAPTWPKGWYRLYVAHAAGGDVAAALAAARRGLAHCPGDPDLARAARALAAGDAAAPPPGDAERCAADAALRTGDWRAAIAGYTRSINAATRAGAPPDRRAFCSRSAAWLRAAVHTDEESAFAAAVADADQCIAIDAAWPKAWYRKAAAYLEDGRPGCAKDVFEQGLVRCPADGELRAGLLQAVRVIEEEGAETDWEDGATSGDDIQKRLSSSSRDVELSMEEKTDDEIDGDTVLANTPVSTIVTPESCSAPLAQFTRISSKGTTFATQTQADSSSETTASLSDHSLVADESLRSSRSGTTHTTPNDQLQKKHASNLPLAAVEGSTDHAPDARKRHSLPVQRSSSPRADAHAEGNGVLRKARASYAMGTANADRNAHVAQDLNLYERQTDDFISVRSVHGVERPCSVQIEKAPGVHWSPAEEEVQAARRPQSTPTAGIAEVFSDDESLIRQSAHREARSFSDSAAASVRTELEKDSGARAEAALDDGASDTDSNRVSNADEEKQSNRAPDSLYELLGVARSATEAEIKKAYYELARRLHPDKNQADPEATAKFQRLADAYRVLSNAKSRALYDKYGERELARNGVETVDPSTLFAMVFGSDHFGHLIGELQVASLANAVDEHGNAPASQVLDRIQKDRVGKLALHLIRMVQPWVDGQRADFLEWATTEARRLAEANFGTQLLHVVGRAYTSCSAMGKAAMAGAGRRGMRSLPATISGALAGGMYRTQRARAQLRASAAASRVMAKQRRMHDRVLRLGRSGKALSAAEAERMAVEMAECAVDMMWKLAVVDIETTIADVVAAVLSGKDVDAPDHSARDTLVADRAAAIRVLGRAFCAVRSRRGSAGSATSAGAAVARGDPVGRRLANLHGLGTRGKA